MREADSPLNYIRWLRRIDRITGAFDNAWEVLQSESKASVSTGLVETEEVKGSIGRPAAKVDNVYYTGFLVGKPRKRHPWIIVKQGGSGKLLHVLMLTWP